MAFDKKASDILADIMKDPEIQSKINPSSKTMRANQLRNEGWKEVANRLNAQTPGEVRTVEAIKKRWKNMLGKAKKENSEFKKYFKEKI